MRPTALAPLRDTLLVALLALSGCSADPQWILPGIMTSSRHVDYGAWADAADVCMDDKLAAWDGYIEDLAAYLGVAPPTERMFYSWVPKDTASDTAWPCSATAGGCTHYGAEGYQALVFARNVEELHEFVHAVEVPALGRAHRVFEEGMAHYLSQRYSTEGALPDFALEFEDMIAHGVLSSMYYQRSMHFVGSLIGRGGIDKYYRFRAVIGTHGTWSDFVKAYREIYDADLLNALAEMELTPVQGRGPSWGCDADLTGLPWSTAEAFEATLRGKCGDDGFYSGGLVDGELAASRLFTLDVKNRGVYKITVQAADGAPTGAVVEISSCPSVRYDDVIVGQSEQREILWEGRHQLRVDYPSVAEARSGVRLSLEYLAIADP